MTSITDVNAFLLKVKHAVANGHFTFVNRQKNLNDLMAHGILLADVIRTLQSLTYHDYSEGPLADEGFEAGMCGYSAPRLARTSGISS